MDEENIFKEPFENNIPKPYQNNILYSFQNTLPEPFLNNIQPYQNNNPGTYQNYQNNIPGAYQNNNQGFYQNIPRPNQNINYQNLNPGNINDELNKKMNNLKKKFFTLLIFIFIEEIVLIFCTFIILNETIYSHSRDSNYGEGFEIIEFVLFVYPILIIFSSIILCCSCNNNNPDTKITVSIIFSILKGVLMIFIFAADKRLIIFGVVLEIFNLSFMITSICYQNQIKKILFS